MNMNEGKLIRMSMALLRDTPEFANLHLSSECLYWEDYTGKNRERIPTKDDFDRVARILHEVEVLIRSARHIIEQKTV